MTEAALETAERALALASPDSQVTVIHERSLLSRFARSAPTQATEVDDVTVEILALCDGHIATASTNRLDEEGLRATAERAAAAARASASAGPGAHPGLTEAGHPPPAHQGFDPETARLDPERAGAALRETFAVAAEHGLEAFGVWTVGDVETAIASSTGVRLSERVPDAFMKVICRDADGRSGFASATATAASDIDPVAVARRAAAKVSSAPPSQIGPGTYPVVLEPEAVGLLLEFFGSLALNGLAHVEGRGALSDKLGTPVAAPAISLSDSPRFPRTLARAFDFEGVPKAPIALVQEGIAEHVVHDRRSAALAGGGARSTGHATQPGGSPFGPVPTNLVLAGGGAANVDELAAPIELGIYVTRLWYVNPVREKETLLTGMTREGTFLIEDGKITRPLRDVRFTDSILRLLSATEALTREQRLVTEGEFYGRRFAHGVVCPALRADGFRVTGATT
ncbi:MAG TPA: metallopeptidase TldD-related protein [Solirubrobacteraceae bacterium]